MPNDSMLSYRSRHDRTSTNNGSVADTSTSEERDPGAKPAVVSHSDGSDRHGLKTHQLTEVHSVVAVVDMAVGGDHSIVADAYIVRSADHSPITDDYPITDLNVTPSE